MIALYVLAGVGCLALVVALLIALAKLLEWDGRRQRKIVEQLRHEKNQLLENLENAESELEMERDARAREMRGHAAAVASARKPPKKGRK
jgi:hypothetical protein